MPKDLQERLKEKNQELSMALNIIANFTDGLLFFDEKNKLALMNEKAEKLLDISKKKHYWEKSHRNDKHSLFGNNHRNAAS